MTNNPTIDGVSRADLEAAVKADASQGATASELVAGWAAMARLRVVLDADKVNNRQMGLVEFADLHPPHPYGYIQNPMREDFEQWAAEESEVRGVGETIGLSTDEHHDRYSMIWTQTSWIAWQASQAAQQSTIARLEARVAELESGRGEPVAWEMDDTAGESGLIQLTNNLSVRDDWVRNELPVCPLFSAPPAPVSVVLPERKTFEPPSYRDQFAEGWNACIVATAALNGPAK